MNKVKIHVAPLILWILTAPVWAHKPSLSPGSSSLALKPHHSPWGKAMISPSGHYLHKARLNFHLGADILENKCSCFFKQPKSHHSSYRSLMLLSFSFWRRKKKEGEGRAKLKFLASFTLKIYRAWFQNSKLKHTHKNLSLWTSFVFLFNNVPRGRK